MGVDMSDERRHLVFLLQEGAKAGPYDERPVVPAKIDPQVTLSRNDRPQPFYLICEEQTVLATMTGRGAVAFHGASVRQLSLVAGDHVFVPARTPHRILPETPMIQLRFKARVPGREAVVWYCPRCDAEVWRHGFDASAVVSQRGWWDGVSQFNADPARRRCACGEEHPAVDVDGLHWADLAAELEAPPA